MAKKKQDPDAPKSGKDLARKPRGFPDRREALIHAQAEMIDRVTSVYRRWGFEALDTGAFGFFLIADGMTAESLLENFGDSIDGTVGTLEDLLGATRFEDDYAGPRGVGAVKGHAFGVDLPAPVRSDLLAYLRSL